MESDTSHQDMEIIESSVTEPRCFRQVKVLGNSEQQCVSSHIRIDEDMVDVFKKLYRDQPLANTTDIFNGNFNLAKTMCHEVIHALYLAIDPQAWKMALFDQYRGLRTYVAPAVPLLFMDEQVVESGNSWEQHVFGGCVKWEYKEPFLPSTFFKWRNWLTGGRYLRKPMAYTKATKYFVSKHYLLNIREYTLQPQLPFTSHMIGPISLCMSVCLYFAANLILYRPAEVVGWGPILDSSSTSSHRRNRIRIIWGSLHKSLSWTINMIVETLVSFIEPFFHAVKIDRRNGLLDTQKWQRIA